MLFILPQLQGQPHAVHEQHDHTVEGAVVCMIVIQNLMLVDAQSAVDSSCLSLKVSFLHKMKQTTYMLFGPLCEKIKLQ